MDFYKLLGEFERSDRFPKDGVTPHEAFLLNIFATFLTQRFLPKARPKATSRDMLKSFFWFLSAVALGASAIVILGGESIWQQVEKLLFFTLGWMVCYYWGPPKVAHNGSRDE
jgi:hypothetical protein